MSKINVILGSQGFFAKSLKKDKFFKKCIFISKDDYLNFDLVKNKLKNNQIENCLILFGIKKQHGDNYKNFIINQKIDKNIILFLKKFLPQKIIYISSTEVYDTNKNNNNKIKISSRISPVSFYGLSKISSEFIIKNFSLINNIRFLSIRVPLVYGKYDSSNSYGPNKFINLYKSGLSIDIWGKGEEYREFIYIIDFVNFIKIIFNNSFSGIINLVSGKSYQFIEIINLMRKLSNDPVNISYKKRNQPKVNIFFTKDPFLSKIKFKFTPLKDGIHALLKNV